MAGSAGAATPAEDAEALVKRGVELRKEFKDQEALEQFQRAYQLVHEPRIEAQIGIAEQALGRWIDAEAHVSGALTAPADPWIAKNRDALEQSLVAIRSHLGQLEVIVTPKGAEILVDGRSVGRAPLSSPLRVREGSAVVEVRASGYFSVTRTVAIRADELTRETVGLQATSPGRAVEGPATEDRVTERPPDHDGGGTGAWKRPTAWALAGAAVAFAGGGVAALFVRNDKANSYNRLVDMTNCEGEAMATCQDLRSDGSTATTLAGVGFGVAAAMAIASGILFATAPNSSNPSVALTGCGVAANARGFACALSF